MEEEQKTEEFNLEPVEIHEEMYSSNLFGEVIVKKEEEEELIGPKAKSAFNIFAFTDAIGARKKRDAWVLYQKAIAQGVDPDKELFWKVVWQVKNMIIAGKTKSVSETDMSPYPYQKAKGYAKNFSTSELTNLSTDLVLGYHKARRGEGEIEILVEKTLLRL